MPRPKKRRALSVKQRVLIKGLRYAGSTLRQIIADFKSSPNTVKHTLDRETETGWSTVLLRHV
ncbi:uncharacterized protein LOC143230845 isoform X2 [Tachypleus tridentatus]|uniref:uncharacterized protein LOC143230845 isoform X2 n=1 Tax=Tachypleus tridentatus TaxID=6853 RepID=UPI003FD56870